MLRRIVIAYWLIPGQATRNYFQTVINDLAQRYDAPVFEPHVTVHVGANCRDAVDEVLSKVAQSCEPIVLRPLEVSNSSEFTKTLFVRFSVSPDLQHFNEITRGKAKDSSNYQLDPHLSLLYKRMSVRQRCSLTDSIKCPFTEVRFDSLTAVQCISPTRSRADVEAWRVVAKEDLTT